MKWNKNKIVEMTVFQGEKCKTDISLAVLQSRHVGLWFISGVRTYKLKTNKNVYKN